MDYSRSKYCDEAEGIWNLLKNGIEKTLKRNMTVSFHDLYHSAYTMVHNNDGERLYNGLRQVVTQHLESKDRQDVLASVDNNFLQTLIQAWNHHQKSMTLIRDVLMYMDRSYVKQNKVDNIYYLGMKIFKDQVVRHEGIADHLRQTLLEMAVRGSRAELDDNDRSSMKATCQMLIVLGIAESTEQRTVELADEAFYMNTIIEMENSAVLDMLKSQKIDGLHCTYKWLIKHPERLRTIATCVSQHLRDEGTPVVTEDEGGALNVVQRLLHLKDQYDKFVNESFEGDEIFKQAVSSEFQNLLSVNTMSAEYLALFIDEQLKQDNNRQIGTVLDKTMALLRLLRDKQVFKRHYEQHLVERINKSAKVDNEKKMIAKLQTEFGDQYATKLQGILLKPNKKIVK